MTDISNRLLAGNKKYIETVDKLKLQDTADNGQHPFAIVVCCSDSRVIPEQIFDASIGDIFVIRVAGNVLDRHQLGSIEYAAAHIGFNRPFRFQCGISNIMRTSLRESERNLRSIPK